VGLFCGGKGRTFKKRVYLCAQEKKTTPMKKLLFGSAALVGMAMLSLTSCKSDETAPAITISGGNTQTVSLNAALTDPGATANDDSDGDVTSLVTSDYLDVVDENQTGTYTVTYTVADKAGNVGTATKAVTVRNDAYMLAGNYAVTDLSGGSSTPYTETIGLSTTVNNRITFTKFAAYANNNAIYANVTGTNITVPAQTTPSPVGNPAAIRTFDGNGTTSTVGFIINYNENTNGSTSSGIGTYIKQ
jgi:hypothetical protein